MEPAIWFVTGGYIVPALVFLIAVGRNQFLEGDDVWPALFIALGWPAFVFQFPGSRR